jgi:hypothetical protein
MDIATFARFNAATTGTQRLQIQRMRRLTQVAALGFLSSAKKELARDHAGHGADAAICRKTYVSCDAFVYMPGSSE